MSASDVGFLIKWQEKAIELLKRIQWSKIVSDDVGHHDFQESNVCPECGGYKPGSYAPVGRIGHKHDCLLKEMLHED